MAPTKPCPICNRPALQSISSLDSDATVFEVVCLICGRYRIDGTLALYPSGRFGGTQSPVSSVRPREGIAHTHLRRPQHFGVPQSGSTRRKVGYGQDSANGPLVRVPV